MTNSNAKKNTNKTPPVLFLSIGMILIIIIAFSILYSQYAVSFTQVSLQKYHDIYESNSIVTVVEDNLIQMDSSPIIKDNVVYVPIDFIKSYIDEYIFWDELKEKVIITTTDKVIRMSTKELNYYINNKPFTLNLPVYNIEGIAFIPTDLLEEIYNIKFMIHDSNILTLDYTDNKITEGDVSNKKTKVRNEPTTKSSYVSKILKNDVVKIYETDGIFTKIRTSNGTIGYIKTKHIKNAKTIKQPIVDDIKESNTSKIEDKVILLWDQVFNVVANSSEFRREPHKGLNVLSPTWLSFDLEAMNGDIINIADKSYVDWAHSEGYQVWALIDDFPNKGGANVVKEILTNTESRENAILQLLSLVAIYELDGINIDFEYVKEEDGIYLLQFMRELYPFMSSQNKILSFDAYVPKPWTEHYNRTELAKTSDYIAVMAYDEHYSGSPVSGAVASIGFVEEGITETLKQVPKEQILLGLPFYQRIWREENIDGEVKLSKQDTGMQRAYDIFRQNGAEFVWQNDKGLYYGEYTTIEKDNTVTYKVWLEDERSIQQKIDLAIKYDLAGIAGWKRGLEKESLWDIIYKYSKN
jgi:spore germination protein YaaH